jgi:TM2 domain-containing membrane protein YozV
MSSSSHDRSLNVGAAFLGWLVPGLGQIVIGERSRGIYALIGVLGLFLTGVFVGGIDCVDRKEDTLWFSGQAAVGPIAIAVSYANDALLKNGAPESLVPTPPSGGDPRGQPRLIPAAKGLAHANEFGTLLCFLAGLMNFVVILDAVVRSKGECPYERRQSPAGKTAAGGTR